jgi:hypothetical protein
MRVKKQHKEIPYKLNIMNVYNNGKLNIAVCILEENWSKFPWISLCGGDFNIQDSMWDNGLDPNRAHNTWTRSLQRKLEALDSIALK